VQARVDISYLIVDLKFDGKNIKILEFGEGVSAGLNGYEYYYGPGALWQKFWDYLRPFDMPMWYVGKYWENRALERFINMGGHFAWREKDLCVDCVYDNEAHKPLTNNEIDGSYVCGNKSIKDHKGIIILTGSAHERDMQKYKSKYPDFIMLNQATAPFARSKHMMSLLFQDNELWKYRPQCKAYEKKYSHTLARNIIRDFKCDTYVIKPLNSSQGKGIIMAKKNELDKYLRIILMRRNNLHVTQDLSFRYWLYDKNTHFIIEEYEPSKAIFVNKKKYDPTMRVVFTLDYDLDKINLTFLGSYWKLPKQPLDSMGTLIEKTKSKIIPGKLSSALVREQDISKVQEILSEALPKIYKRMLGLQEEISREILTRSISPVKIPVPILKSMYAS